MTHSIEYPKELKEMKKAVRRISLLVNKRNKHRTKEIN